MQKELAAERAAVRDYVRGSALLRKFFEVFLFEEVPAADVRPDELYLDKVDHCDIYLGLFGYEYGRPDGSGRSPTHQEFARATEAGKFRLVLIKGQEDELREPRMLALIKEAQSELSRKRFGSHAELFVCLDEALVHYLETKQLIRNGPFDAAPCLEATMEDLDPKKMENFVKAARRERRFPLGKAVEAEELLQHLSLLDGEVPTNAAVLLFGSNPKKFFPSAEVKCGHYHTPEVVKPIPSYQRYEGTVFDMIDQAVDFVMAKIDRRVGTRKEGTAVPVDYEIPREVIEEAIVNAVAHRDYSNHGSVQVMLFPDRLEVWNPGALPPTLTLESLRGAHGSVPANPRLAEALYLAHYIERMGTGIGDMIRRCRESGLREPDFAVTDGFVATVFRKAGQVSIPNGQVTGQVSGQVAGATGQVAGQVTGQVDAWVLAVLEACRAGPLKSKEIQVIAGIKHRESFQRNYLDRLLDEGWVERTVPDKPRSRMQRYRLTLQGEALLTSRTDGSTPE